MQKIVIDTNVIVSVLISKGIPANIINELVFEKKVILCISDAVLDEYSEVLSREKLTALIKSSEEKETLLVSLENVLFGAVFCTLLQFAKKVIIRKDKIIIKYEL